jgi:AraC family cel operon transcriptional repressor
MKAEILDYRKNFSNPDANLDLHLWKKNLVPYHTHNYYELVLVQKGIITHVLNEEKAQLAQNCLMIIKPSDKHSMSFSANEPCLHANLSVKKDFFEHSVSLVSTSLLNNIFAKSGLSVTLNRYDMNQVNFLIKRINLTDNQDVSQKNSLITSLLFFLISLFIVYKKDSTITKTPEWFSSLLDRVNSPEFIDKSAKDIYDISPYSTAMLIKFFKKYLNCTPTDYLTNIKINYACNRLHNTDYSILYIANEIGFTSLSHFNHVFKKLKGYTPTDYRKMGKPIKV